jgi:predicted alpha-1,2-mannosidase
MKGYRDFDVEKAYAGMRKNATEATVLPWKRGPLTELDKIYQEKGFLPALAKGETETVKDVHPSEKRQAVAVTLENAYDDWCLAQMAKALHKDPDYEYFMKRAHAYQLLYDSRIGFMAPKSADGNWVEGFNPKLGGGQGGRDYFAEMNSWSYTFHVQQDIPGLINLMGGKEAFASRLDALFTEGASTSKWTFLGQFPDMTGLIGQYSSGNEPSAHNYAGQPWKAQFRLRQIMKIWYDDRLLGIPGDDDGGSLSAWYVFSAMGFFPVTVGKPGYDIGSPLFSRIQLSLGNGKKFTIIASKSSAQNKYIQSAKMNGKPLSGPWFTHDDIVGGGTLVLEMGPKPNKSWGANP